MARAGRASLGLLLVSLLLSHAAAEIYFQEKFDDSWSDRWHSSTWKEDEQGEFKLTAGKWYGDEREDRGIQTGPEDEKFFATWADMGKEVSNEGKTLVLQFSVKHEQDLDCGGGYIKLVPASSADQMEGFGGNTPYSIMFGPDICGYSTRKVHVILTRDGTNHLINKDIPAKTDQLTHVYTLVIKPDNTYQVLIDLEEVAAGALEDDWSLLPPKTIADPAAVKPDDWDERPTIPDPEDAKPAGWDDVPRTIPDPEAVKPADWSDEDDGVWEPAEIPNPEYKGEWKPRMLDNPAYKGAWSAPLIPNPAYTPEPRLYVLPPLKYVGFELWQVKTGTIFDNILVADSLDEARAFAAATWGASKDSEKAMFDAAQKAKEEAAAAAAKEAAEADGGADGGAEGGGAHDEL